MPEAFAKFLKKNIDLSPVGVDMTSCPAAYFCTPKGASIIGCAGVDGIHYCFVRSFGETVFAVSPMNTAPDHVHPLAKSFEDFLRLLLACKDAAVLEQAWMWDKAQFETFLKENPATEEQKKTLSDIAGKMKLTPMEQPWEYIKALQSSFDYSKIRYTEDYYDPDMNPASKAAFTEWKVYFDGGFRGHSGKDRAGKELPIGKQFEWAGHHWLIPAAYSCSKGLVVDLCLRACADDIRAFMDKWDLTRENDSCENFTPEQQMELERENPLSLDFDPLLLLNGRALRTSHGCAVTYDPCLPEEAVNYPEADLAVGHYGLDTAYGWVIYRYAFPWGQKRRPDIKTLSLTLEQQPVSLPGPHFTAKAPGDAFSFVHPLSQTEYTLTVQELERQTLPKNAFPSDRCFYPAHFTAMSYTLSPETPEHITVCDCDEGDRPLEIMPENVPFAPAAANAAALCIIGGADGPTAISVGQPSQGRLCTACSSLHFEPVRHDVEWRIVFREKLFEDIDIELNIEEEPIA